MIWCGHASAFHVWVKCQPSQIWLLLFLMPCLLSCLGSLCFLVHQTFTLFSIPIFVIVIPFIFNEGHSGNVLCELNYIFTFLFICKHTWFWQLYFLSLFTGSQQHSAWVFNGSIHLLVDYDAPMVSSAVSSVWVDMVYWICVLLHLTSPK